MENFGAINNNNNNNNNYSIMAGTGLNLITGGESSQLSSRFTELIREQHFSLLHGGQLVVELNIEGPTGANNSGFPTDAGHELAVAENGPSAVGDLCICGRKRKAPETENSPIRVDLNQFPSDSEEEYCNCEDSEPPVPVVQLTTENVNQLAGIGCYDSGSGSNGSAGGQQSQPNPEVVEIPGDNRAAFGRSVRSRRRGIPRRFVPDPARSSAQEIPIYDDTPPIINYVTSPPSPPMGISGPGPVAASFGVAAAMGLPPPFRIRDVIARRDDEMLNPLVNSAPTFPPMQNVFDSSGLNISRLYNSLNTAHTSLIPTMHPFPNFQVHPNTNNVNSSQSGGSSSMNITEEIPMNPSGMIEHILNDGYRRPETISVAFNTNPGEFVGLTLQSTNSGSLQVTSINNNGVGLPPVQGHILYQGHEVVDILSSDDEDHNDELDEMRMDIEEMSYEDLLDLGETIGDVQTGLTEEVILERLVRRYYRAPPPNKNKNKPENKETCCICLAEFENRDVLGKISCNHKMHFECIQKWLVEKNFCPMCKQTALPPPPN